MSKAPFYITTPIYYVNDIPHIGHAYCTVVADVLARYHRLMGVPTLFLTGVDEHGQKVQAAAEKRGLDPKKHCDEMAENFRAIWKELNISNDIFFRTTDSFHKKAVQDCLSQLHDAGEIYTKEYEGWYAQADEIFYTEKDLVDGKAPTGTEVTKITEKNYFFKMSKYQERLISHIEKNPGFIEPSYRKNEVLGFLRQPLNDLCISRPKSRLSWGIELPFDRDYVTYVWFDALLNYATGVGLKQSGKTDEFKKWWNASPSPVMHLLGKDILTTHSVYWPTMLMALGLELPRTIYAHGWWLTQSNEKMSKSKGTVVKPLDVKNIIGVDALRYFLSRDVRLGNDSQFSIELVINRVNSELSNNFGNLLSRTCSLIAKYFGGQLPVVEKLSEKSEALKAVALSTHTKLEAHLASNELQEALGVVIDMLTNANQYLADREPWKMAKTDLPHAGETLTISLECVRIAAILLTPVMPTKCEELLKRLGGTSGAWSEASKFLALKPGTVIANEAPLFMRVELPKAEA
ncbi:MAG: methionine--tRNA ligase [Xanthomonadaceae bacterium]|nr:methionine--tRNA ligase [Xanthomonadaceae bacterium]